MAEKNKRTNRGIASFECGSGNTMGIIFPEVEQSASKVENLIIFIENDIDKLEEIKSNSKEMRYWTVIWAFDIEHANDQLDKISDSKETIKNLIIRGHGSNNSIVLSFEFGEEGDPVDDRAVNIQGINIRNYLSPRSGGIKANLVYENGGMSELQYDTIKFLESIGNKIRTDAVVCFSNCRAGNDLDLGVSISNLLKKDILLNRGIGGTSGKVTISKKNSKTGKKIPGTTKSIKKLLLPRSISTPKTRHQGFILFPINREGSELKGEVIVNDSKNNPLIIKEK